MAVNSPSLSLHLSPTDPPLTPDYLDINYPDKTSHLCSDVSPPLAVFLSLKSRPEIATVAHRHNQGPTKWWHYNVSFMDLQENIAQTVCLQSVDFV